MQLIEGKTYSFSIVSLVEMPDGNFFVLSDSNGKKYMLPENQYQDYELKEGTTINCRVDKINCTGKIFLEPQHPLFTKNKIYNFTYLGKTQIINSYDEKELQLLVLDINNNKWTVPINDNSSLPKKNSSILLKVHNVKKGKPLLSNNLHENTVNKLKIGLRYRFTITGISTLIKDKEYFRLTDDYGNIHFIRCKFYNDYGYKINEVIFCKVLKPKTYGNYYLEPDYPDHTLQKTYSFNVIRKDKHYNKDGTIENCLIVSDNNGRECTVFFQKNSNEVYNKHIIKAKIEYIFKGRLHAILTE